MAAADSLIDYPCAFPVKVMGEARDELRETVSAIVQRHDPGFEPSSIEMRASRGGKFLSLTCVVTAVSRSQLDALYRELSGHPLVKLVL